MSGKITDVKVASQLAFRSISARLRSNLEPAPDLAKFKSHMNSILDSVMPGLIAESQWINIPASQPPWISSGIALKVGDEISYFVEGRTYVSSVLDIWINPALQLWCKVGDDGDIFRGTRKGHSFKSDNDGLLRFGNYFPNDWSNRQGSRQQSDDVYKQASGEIWVLVIRWTGTALDGLRMLAKDGDHEARLQSEIERLIQGNTTPAGWYHLWNIGASEIFRDKRIAVGDSVSDCDTIHCHTKGDTGILQYDVDMALTKETELSWRWCIDELPSSIREDSLPSHDYLSIAVEFDNGRDITYYWSSKLPVGTGYDCPLPNWAGKEYHVVVRSGGESLGQWLNERRNLYEDYELYMGQVPARIVRIWLIANSVLQRGTGTCDYAEIVIQNKESRVQVL